MQYLYTVRYNTMYYYDVIGYSSVLVGPCHHGMARPQVVDKGKASNKEGSCE